MIIISLMIGRDVTETKLFFCYVCAMLNAPFPSSPCNDDALVRFLYERDWFYN